MVYPRHKYSRFEYSNLVKKLLFLSLNSVKSFRENSNVGAMQMAMWTCLEQTFNWLMILKASRRQLHQLHRIITRSLIDRYMELVHPIWHRTHFKKSWLRVVIPFTWLFGVAVIGSHHLSTTKVTNPICS